MKSKGTGNRSRQTQLTYGVDWYDDMGGNPLSYIDPDGRLWAPPPSDGPW